ncbi:MAG: glycosyltransferase family 2 protein [Candidatus Bathyarchaeota archaeon]|nr:glycosyltransferase family 2 protein [Candidatus Termiticorpusculum sp.]
MVEVLPFVSIIILNYNGESYLDNCVASVLENSYPNFEVLLVDNASTDLSVKNVLEVFGGDSRLRLIQSATNLGFSGGNNLGFAHAKGDFIVFLNNDTIVDPSWLTYLVNALQADDSIGLAQSTILMFDGQKIQTAGWLYSNYLVQKHGLAENKDSNLRLQSVFEVSVASGASMITRRSLIAEIGLFDPKIPFFYDDTLLSFKVWLANKRVVTVSESKIRHIQGATNVWNIRRTTYNLLKAKICLLFDVYYSIGDLVGGLFVNLFSIGVNSLFFLKKRNLSVIFANIQALTWGLKNFRYLWRNRLSHWAKKKITPRQLQERFVRIRLPLPLYLAPSKLSINRFAFETEKYESSLIDV